MPDKSEYDLELSGPVGPVLRRILGLARPYVLYIVTGIAIGLIGGAAAFFLPLIEGRGINELLKAFEEGNLSWESFRPLMRVVGLLMAVGSLQLALRYCRIILASHLRMKIMTDLRRKLYRKLLRQSFSYYDTQDSGLLINRTIGDVSMLRMFYTMILLRGSETVFSITFFMVYLIIVDSYVAAVAAPFLLLYIISMIMAARKIHPMFHDMRYELDSSTQILSENVQGIQVVRAFGREEEETTRYNSAINAILQRWRSLAGVFCFFQPSVMLIGELLMVSMLAAATYRVFYGPLSVGIIYVVYRWSRLLEEHMRFISRMTAMFEHSLVSAERIFEILDARPDVMAPSNPTPLPAGGGRVVFENVSFAYNDREPVLKNINLDIPAGCNVALVGRTGSGKSTLIKLLPRFYNPTEGRILIDGTDISTVDLDDLRSNIGFVFQDSFLFSASLAENIAFGVPEAEQKAIENAARRAMVSEFAAAFDDGYDTRVGERGITLSGGQRQRVAIARALLVDPRILILDDATASVDSNTERDIQEGMAEVMADRTTFIIAHRATTVKRADMVVVIDEGRVAEQGTHEELMKRDGLYREFCRMQWQLGLDDEEVSQ